MEMTPFTPKILPLQKEIKTTKILKKSISAKCAEAHYVSVTFILDNVFMGRVINARK